MDFDAFFVEGDSAQPTQAQVFLADLGEEDWKRFLTIAQHRSFAPGEVLIQQEEVSRTFFIVASGRLEVFFTDADATQHHVYFIEPMSIVGEQAFFDGHPRSATVRALTAGEVFGITPEGFELLSVRHPDVARIALFDLGRILAQRLRDMTNVALRGRRL